MSRLVFLSIALELQLIKPLLKDRALCIRLPATAAHGAKRT